jgi:FkbM family methyltransferase
MFQNFKKVGRRCKKAIASFYTALSEEETTYYNSFSQEGEDMILRRIFEHKQNGFYIDIGAFHPQSLSNTYFFYQLGWRGLNIDAMPGSMKIFNQIRPRDINLERAISHMKETLTYYEFNAPNLNGFSQELSLARDGWKVGDWEAQLIDKREITTYTLVEIFNEYLAENQVIDFLSVDVEGLDYQVLMSNDWAKYQPNIVLVEDLEITSLDSINKSRIYNLMREQGYELYSKSVNTLIFKLNIFQVGA